MPPGKSDFEIGGAKATAQRALTAAGEGKDHLARSLLHFAITRASVATSKERTSVPTYIPAAQTLLATTFRIELWHRNFCSELTEPVLISFEQRRFE